MFKLQQYFFAELDQQNFRDSSQFRWNTSRNLGCKLYGQWSKCEGVSPE